MRNVCRVRVGYTCFGSGFGLRGLWVVVYSFCEDVHADQHCDPKDVRLTSTCAPLMVHLQTAWNTTTRIKEVQCGHYPGKRRVRG